MANTRGSSPYSTYKTDRVQLIGNPEQRTYNASGYDQRFINCYPTVTESPINGAKKYQLEQRGALTYQSSLSGTAGEGRGIYYYNSVLFCVIDARLYRNGVFIQTLSTSTAPVGFVEYASITANYLIVLDGTSGWTITPAGVVAQIVSANFPSPHYVKATYLDGYLFVAKQVTGDIYNCVLNDPFTWNAGDFISAEMYPDTLNALVRQNNYIVAIGKFSTEYFYNTGVFPGTPLARNTAGARTIGTPARHTVVSTEEQIIFVGQTGVGGKTIWIFNGFQATEIGIDAVKKSINGEGDSISDATAFCVRSGGHRFYVLHLSLSVYTWVYDFDTQMWHQWAAANGTSNFPCPFATDGFGNNPYMLNMSSGEVSAYLYGFSRDTTASTTTELVSTAVTAKIDFGVMNRKFMSRFSLIGNITLIPGTPPTCVLYWSDDDYQTWSAGVSLDLTKIMPTVTQLGSFRRRAFKLVYNSISPILIEGFEVDTNMGSQ